MKTKYAISALFSVFAGFFSIAQDIPQNQVPSVIVNHFQQQFPKARDVEWELKGNQYKVEFETGLLGDDHDVWYDKTGKLVRHESEISKGDLPQKVKATLDSQYANYRVDDVKKIDEAGKIVYKIEVKSSASDWDLAIDSNGKVLSKVAD